jgi:hypothetical protein
MLSGLCVNGNRKRESFTDPDSANLRLQTLQTALENTGTLADRIARKPEHATEAARQWWELMPKAKLGRKLIPFKAAGKRGAAA